MVNRVGTKLSIAIRERAYSSGSLEKLRDTDSRLTLQLGNVRSAIEKHESRIAKLDRLISELSAIQVSDIAAIRPKPRLLKSAHGAFRKALIALLKEHNRPWTTGEIAEHMAATFGMPIEDIEDRRKMLERIRRPLNLFRLRGAVERLPARVDSDQGVWRWIGTTTRYESGTGGDA